MEVRDPSEHQLKVRIKKIGLVWRQCESCGLEFRKTSMWSWKGLSYSGEDRFYACPNCISSYEDLIEFIQGKKEKKEKDEKRKIGFHKE